MRTRWLQSPRSTPRRAAVGERAVNADRWRVRRTIETPSRRAARVKRATARRVDQVAPPRNPMASRGTGVHRSLEHQPPPR
jgi:hypothetical protein